MAFSGHIGTQPPQPLQPVGLITAAWRPPSSPIEIASYGQAVRQSSHAVHATVSTIATSGSSSVYPFLRTAPLWVTAARPEATLSAEVFGPWQAPAISTPSTTVS